MNLENYTKMRALQAAHTSTNSTFIDHILAGSQGDELREKILTKRLQFDTTPQLYSEVESVCSLLDCSKREFLEMAVWDALKKSKDIFFSTYEEVSGQEYGEPVLSDSEPVLSDSKE